jgi:hypothetical protein
MQGVRSRASARATSATLALLFLASCNGSSGSLGVLPGPNTPPAFMRLFDAKCDQNKIYIMAPPIAAPLTPAGSFAQPCSRGMAFATNGMLAVSSGAGGSLKIYNPPYSSMSGPSVTITGISSTLALPTGVAWDGNGNVWVADEVNDSVDEFSPPFSASSAPAATNTFVAKPSGLAFNPVAQLMFVGYRGGDVVRVYPAPYTGVPIATLDTTLPRAIAVDLFGRLFAADSSTGVINVFVPPYATGNTPVFSLSAGAGVDALAFDSAQNLYAQLGGGGVVVFSGPILGPKAAPSAVLGCPTGSGLCTGANKWAGIAIGP